MMSGSCVEWKKLVPNLVLMPFVIPDRSGDQEVPVPSSPSSLLSSNSVNK